MHQEIEPCLELFLVFQESGSLSVDRTNTSDVSAVLKTQMCDNTWLFCRALMGASTQTVPAWAGWVTLTGGSEDEVPKLSRVDYLSPIINPITENIGSTTVRHILKVSQQASIRGWPRIYISALTLQWQRRPVPWSGNSTCQVFDDVIVRMGGFHTGQKHTYPPPWKSNGYICTGNVLNSAN